MLHSEQKNHVHFECEEIKGFRVASIEVTPLLECEKSLKHRDREVQV